MNYIKPIVKLVGEDGNAYYILGKTVKALRKAGASEEIVKQYQKEATLGDYDNLLAITMNYVEVK